MSKYGCNDCDDGYLCPLHIDDKEYLKLRIEDLEKRLTAIENIPIITAKIPGKDLSLKEYIEWVNTRLPR